MYIVYFTHNLLKYNHHSEGQLSSEHLQFKPLSFLNICLKADTPPSREDWGRNKIPVNITVYEVSYIVTLYRKYLHFKDGNSRVSDLTTPPCLLIVRKCYVLFKLSCLILEGLVRSYSLYCLFIYLTVCHLFTSRSFVSSRFPYPSKYNLSNQYSVFYQSLSESIPLLLRYDVNQLLFLRFRLSCRSRFILRSGPLPQTPFGNIKIRKRERKWRGPLLGSSRMVYMGDVDFRRRRKS